MEERKESRRPSHYFNVSVTATRDHWAICIRAPIQAAVKVASRAVPRQSSGPLSADSYLFPTTENPSRPHPFYDLVLSRSL
jgi:hypothetical protein